MPRKVAPTRRRKADHLRINLVQDVSSGLPTGLEGLRLPHCAIPQIDFTAVSTSSFFLGRAVQAPLLISSMTGGTIEAHRINVRLAEAAQASGIAMGVGSQRVALEDPTLARSFALRKIAPDALLFANIGAVQLNYGYKPDACQRAVDMLEADALILHLNPLQEALQSDGDSNFADLLSQIAAVCAKVRVPVIAKEVGWGISASAARKLIDAGIAAIDVAGAGGTSWSQVEMYRAKSAKLRAVAAAFRSWGIPTAECLEDVRAAFPTLPLIASGGLRDGIDVVKCLALGASLCGMAGPFLHAAARSTTKVLELIETVTLQLRTAMFAAGCANIESVNSLELRRDPNAR